MPSEAPTRTVGASSATRFGAYGSPRNGLRLQTHDHSAYMQQMMEQAAQRKLERELYTLAILEEHDRKESERRDASQRRAAAKKKAKSDEDAAESADQNADASQETTRPEGADGAASSEQKKPSGADDAGETTGSSKVEHVNVASKEERKKRRADRKEKKKQQDARDERLARQPKPPKTPPGAAPHRPTTAPAAKLSDQEFAKRFSDTQVKAMSARRAKAEQKYLQNNAHTPRINPRPSAEADSEEKPDWEAISNRLYTQEVHMRKQHHAKLQERFAPQPPPRDPDAPKPSADDIAERLYLKGMQREKAKIAAAVEREEARSRACQLFKEKKVSDAQWNARLNGTFASPRGAKAV